MSEEPQTDDDGSHEADFEPNFPFLPKQVGYVVDIDGVNTIDYYQGGANEGGLTKTISAPFKGGGIDIMFLEIDPGVVFPWHTHQPHTADTYWILNGTLEVSYKDNDGEVHSIVRSAEDEDYIYHSPGAHNRLENVGDETARVLNIKLGGGSVDGRLDLIAGDPDKHFDRAAIDKQARGLDIDTRRAHVFGKQDDAVEEW
jgi:mannose-6-phosphate isomerase-like protein (cupin superfamily)